MNTKKHKKVIFLYYSGGRITLENPRGWINREIDKGTIYKIGWWASLLYKLNAVYFLVYSTTDTVQDIFY